MHIREQNENIINVVEVNQMRVIEGNSKTSLLQNQIFIKYKWDEMESIQINKKSLKLVLLERSSIRIKERWHTKKNCLIENLLSFY